MRQVSAAVAATRPCAIVAKIERIFAMSPETASSTGRVMLNVIASIACFEREMILERQRKGIAKAKREGKYKGHARTARAKSADIRRLADKGEKREAIVAQLKIGVASVYPALRAV